MSCPNPKTPLPVLLNDFEPTEDFLQTFYKRSAQGCTNIKPCLVQPVFDER